MEPCWPLFRLKRGGGGCESPPSFLLRSFFESIFFKSLAPGAGYFILAPQVRWGAPFLIDFCTNLVQTWRHVGLLWSTYANRAPSWATLVQELLLVGLVGLREAQRISIIFFICHFVPGIILGHFRHPKSVCRYRKVEVL